MTPLSRLAIVSAALCLTAFPAFAEGEGESDFSACVKKSQTVAFNGKPEQQLSFDYYDCSDNDLHLPRLSFDSGNILRTVTSTGEDAVGPTAQFWPLAGKTPEARIFELASPLVEPAEQGRCHVTFEPQSGTWLFTAKDDYFDEIAANGVWGACGPLGDGSETIQYWMVIDGALIAHVSLLQDRPLFEPDSFSYENTERPGKAD